MLKRLQDRDCAGTVPPLDGLSYLTSAGHFSCARRLSTKYSGAAIKVREAGGNTTKDIRIVGNGIGCLDLPSLIAHCGANNGFIDTWYDQGGGGHDATQATTTKQAKIYDSATGVLLVNGLPAALFDGTDDNYGWAPGLSAGTSPDFTWCAAVKPTSQTNQIFTQFGGNNSSGATIRWYLDTAANVTVMDYGGGNFMTWTPVNTLTNDLYPYIWNKPLNANMNASNSRQSYTGLSVAHTASQTTSLGSNNGNFGCAISSGGAVQFPYKGSANCFFGYLNSLNAAEQLAVETCLAQHCHV